jgi:hypothetical protein
VTSSMATTSTSPRRGTESWPPRHVVQHALQGAHAVLQLRTRRSTTSGRQHVCHGTVDTVRCDGLRNQVPNSRLVILL